MTTKVAQRCTTALSCAAIVILVAVVVTVWVMLGQGAFHPSTRHIEHTNASTSFSTSTSKLYNIDNKQVSFIENGSQNEGDAATKHKELLETSQLNDLGQENVEFVKPLKTSPLPLHDHDIIFDQLHNNHDKPQLRHHSGHFRHQKAEIWDPHPNYEIAAFGRIFHLELEDNDAFLGPDFHITHISENYSQQVRHDLRISGCFYTGKVKGDANSNVAVSLCNGMTGYIRTSDGNYYIEPAEKTSDYLSTFLHRIKKIPHISFDNNNVLVSNEDSNDQCETNDNDEIIEDDFLETERATTKNHVISKRNVFLFDDIDTDHENVMFEKFDENTEVPLDREQADEVYRTTREANWVSFEEPEVNNKYFLKVLVVADKTMVEYHRKDQDLQHYILTLMSHVALLYKDASIGNSITLAVVNVWVLKDLDFTGPTSQVMLRRFCEWQHQNTPKHYHDAALLLTRNTICRNNAERSCDTLGVAEVASACNPLASCAVIRDKGLSTSYTIAHELGHVLGMPHDEDKKCIKYHKGLKHNNIMSKMNQNDTKLWLWSACSRHFVTEFLESSKAKCLSKRPAQDYITPKLPTVLPGEVFKLNKQCELEFGNGSEICSFMKEPCWNLWCSTLDEESGCVTTNTPWADGTPCGTNRLCHHRTCVATDLLSLSLVDGGWGRWQEWGECSRTCGGGIAQSVRYCDNPVPENGGEYCTGRSVRYMSCNSQPCENKNDFRAEQCAEFDGKPRIYNLSRDTEWIPKYGFLNEPEKLCRLYCRPKNSDTYYNLKDKVIDGTKCGLNSFDICVNGICRPGGCDNKLDSSITLDECGICGGDNSQCEEITGSYNISTTSSGYSRIVRIPKGSSNLDIRQRGYMNSHNDDNYLALVDGETGKYILNGKYVVSTHPKDIIFGAIIISYSGSSHVVERITTQKTQKLTKDLVVEVLSVGRVLPPDITYRYVISHDSAPKSWMRHYQKLAYPRFMPLRYGWLYQKQWSKCNSICSGKQTMTPTCIDLVTRIPHPDNYCPESEKHAPQQDCNTHCQLIWNVASYGACSANCGEGYRNVHYNCVKINVAKENYIQSNNLENFRQIVDNKHCAILPPPTNMEPCYGKCEGTRWEYSEWSECSTSCGGGNQRRSAKCIDDNGNEIEEHHCSNQEKVTEQVCNSEKCPVWSSGDWTACSVTCGPGFRTKPFYCHINGRILDPNYCDPSHRRIEKEPCFETPCATWHTEAWSHCSRTCDDGSQHRVVTCRSLEYQIVEERYCQEILKPNETRSCHISDCVDTLPFEDEDNSISWAARFRWITGAWSQCSKSCNGGISSRMVVCRNDLGEEQYSQCDPNQRPIPSIECNTRPCPKWNYGVWSSCDPNCEKHRLVSCQNYTGDLVGDEHCDNATKPPNSEKCKLNQCPNLDRIGSKYYDSGENQEKRFKWKPGRWEQCTNTCGKGVRRRNIECEDTLNEFTLVDQYCHHLKKPKIVKPCERYNCQYTWVESYWSPCSKSCGDGLKTRNVTCHKVYSGGVVDPNPLHRNYCYHSGKSPDVTATCQMSRCGDKFVWKPGPWRECSQRCGKKGRQTRQLWCVSVRNGHKVQKHHCPRSLKPPRKRKCNQWKCLYRNCKEIQRYTNTKENKDYLISINGRTVMIYCYKMDTSEPQEYISLQDKGANYAENYDKRLVDPETCPYQGLRRDDCNCLEIGPERSGTTMFWKVRLNITSLQIKGDDYTFSIQVKGTRMAFGTAGDCYSLKDCAQGRFSIDLTNTSFKINDLVRWKKTGNSANAKIDVMDGGRRIQGRCGGYCGDCLPDPNIGLLVDIT